MIMGACCVDKVHNMLPRLHYDNRTVLFEFEHIV